MNISEHDDDEYFIGECDASALTHLITHPTSRWDGRLEAERLGQSAFAHGLKYNNNPWRKGEASESNDETFEPHDAWALGFTFANVDNNTAILARQPKTPTHKGMWRKDQ